MKPKYQWTPTSKLCQNLLEPQYRNMFRRYSRLQRNFLNRESMLDLADQAEKEEKRMQTERERIFTEKLSNEKQIHNGIQHRRKATFTMRTETFSIDQWEPDFTKTETPFTDYAKTHPHTQTTQTKGD